MLYPLVIIKIGRDCHGGLRGPWSPPIAGEHIFLCRLERIFHLSSHRILVKHFLLGISYLASSGFWQKALVWATLYRRRSFQLNPVMDFLTLAAFGDEKGSFALNIAFITVGWLTVVAFATFSMMWSVCQYWKWLCMFAVCVVFFFCPVKLG